MNHTLFHDCTCDRCERAKRSSLYKGSLLALSAWAVFLGALWAMGRWWWP
jgi:hypothetical protein